MKRLIVVGLVALAVAAVLWLVPTNHYLVLPDRAQPVDPLVAVPGEETAGSGGGVYMVDVLVRKASLFERLFPGTQNGASLVPDEAVNPLGVSETQRRRQSRNQMSRSQEIAAAVALRFLGREVDARAIGVEVVAVLEDAPAQGKLEFGDIIVAARGVAVRSRRALLRVMEAVRPGDSVKVTVRRSGGRQELTVGTRADPNDPDRAVFGIQVEDAAEIDLPLDIQIDVGDIGGPSAGLAFALDIVDELGREVDDGRRVVVTGALRLDGRVLPIGGVKQKTIGAREAGADIFVVPDQNAAEARRHAQDLEILPVSTFREALSNLATT